MLKALSMYKNRGFTAVFIAHALGIFHDNIFRTAFVSFALYRVYDVSMQSKIMWMFLGLVLFVVPFFIFSVFAGDVADKVRKDKLIKIIKFAEIIILALGITGFATGSMPMLFFVLFLKGTQAAFFGPVKYSILSDLTGRENLLHANALIETATCAALLLGIMFGGKEILDMKILFSLMSVSAVFGYLATFALPPVEPADPLHTVSLNVVKTFKDNFFLAFHSRDIFLCALGIAWFWMAGSVSITQIQSFCYDMFAAGNSVFTGISFVILLGLGLGALGTRTLLKGEVNTKYAPLAAVLVTIFILDAAFSLSSIPYAKGVKSFTEFFFAHGIRLTFDIFMAAFFGAIFVVPLTAMLQARSPKKVRSRMVALSYFATTLFVATGALASVTFAKIGFDSVHILTLLAMGNTVFAIGITLMLPKHILRSVISAVLDFMYNLEIDGLEEFKDNKKNAIIVANHNSFLDPLILAVFLPGRPYFAVSSEMASKFWLKPFIKLIRHYVVDPENPMAIKTIIEEVKKGNKIVIFPEGRVSTTGGIMKIHPGHAMIAERSGAEIIPISIEGSQYSLFSRFGRSLKTRPSSKIKVTIYPPEKLNIPQNLKSSERRVLAENKLYDILTYMKFKSSKTNQTLFESVIDARYKMGYGYKLMEDLGRKELSYGKVLTACFVLGKQFTKLSKQGEYVGVFLPTANGCAIGFLALHAFGRVPAMINFSTGIKNVVDSCKTAGIKTVLSSKQFVEKANMHDMVDGIKASGVEVVFLEELKITLADKLFGLLVSFFPRTYYRFFCADVTADDPAVVLFTSGSEGTPKGVVLSHKNILSNVFQISSVIPFSVSDRMFCSMPLFHSFGLTGGFMLPVLSGMKVFFYPSPLHYHVIPQLIYDTNSTIFFATDTFLSGYAKTAHPYDFYSLKYVAVGAEKLKEENLNTWARKFGLRVLELYGATEAAPGIAVSTPMHYNYGSVGRLLPGLEHKLEPVEGLTDGGKLVIKGDNIMLGYLKSDKPGVIQPADGGWHDTGDIVDIDQEGFVYIKGRAKRFAKIAGEMVPLLAVESFLGGLWPDYLHAIVTVPDEKRGEQLVLFTTNPNANRPDMLKYFQEKLLPELYVPKFIEVVGEIPVLGSGKMDYVTMNEIAKNKYAPEEPKSE
ncbi:acyltransferase [Elusimicrobium posterum]|uniref:acyl-[ACP]--phospholipid O-acyltransferase n=1 Tax=Elusimicrobium posterum TaxID=3116653 RepID=UPI003C7112F4